MSLEEFLINHNALYAYCKNLREYLTKGDKNIPTQIKAYIGSFCWEETKEGDSYWRKLCRKEFYQVKSTQTYEYFIEHKILKETPKCVKIF